LAQLRSSRTGRAVDLFWVRSFARTGVASTPKNERDRVKFHMNTMLGIKNLTDAAPAALVGKDREKPPARTP
jgi:catalase